jgi:PAS domain S-box-containing protein
MDEIELPDIAERKRVEEAFARSVAVIEAAHEAAGLGVWSFDFAARTVEGDARARTLFGLAAEGPLARQDWLGAVHPDDRAAVEAELARATESRADFRAEFRVVRAGAGTAWVLAFGRVSYDPADDRPLWMTGVFFDTTERRRAEEALRESRNRFEAAVQAVEGILWTNNARGEMEGEQAGWAALTGQTAEEYGGYGWSKAVHPDDVGPTIAAWNEALAEAGPSPSSIGFGPGTAPGGTSPCAPSPFAAPTGACASGSAYTRTSPRGRRRRSGRHSSSGSCTIGSRTRWPPCRRS